jgi:intracellular multiplication protein IcmL
MANDKHRKFDPLKAVMIRNKFYRGSYRKLLFVLVLSIVCNLFLGGGYYYLLTNPKKPVYFAVKLNGRILPVYPIDEPNQSDKEVLEWAKLAAMGAFTYNYTNYRREFQASSDFFSPWGWQQFLTALKESNNLDAVIAKKMLVTAQLGQNRKYEIQKQGLVSGHYAWRVKIPLIVTYQSSVAFTQENTLITLLILRFSTLNSPAGIGIEQFVVAPG